MAQTLSGLQTSVPLTQLSLKIRNADENFVAQKLFPIKNRAKATGKIRVYGKDNLRRLGAGGGKYNRRTTSPEIDRTYALLSFACEKVRFKELILDTDIRDADDDIADIRMDSTQDLTEQQMLQLEDAALTKAFTAANYATGMTGAGAGGAAWSGAGTPINDVIVAKEKVRVALGGVMPDSICMDMALYNTLATNANVVARVQYVNGPVAVVDDPALKAAWGLKNIFLVGAVENTAPKDSAGTATLAALDSSTTANKALVFKQSVPDALRTNGYGCLIVPRQGDLNIRGWRNNDPEGEFLESGWEWALQFMSVDTAASGKAVGGYLITSI